MENVNDFDKRTLSSFYKVDSNNTSKKNIYFKAACSNLSVSLIAFSWVKLLQQLISMNLVCKVSVLGNFLYTRATQVTNADAEAI